MLNELGIGIGPRTNYLISLQTIKSGNVPIEPTIEHTFVPIDKKANNMPFIAFETNETITTEHHDFVSGEQYDYPTALERARKVFKVMLTRAFTDEEAHILQDVALLTDELAARVVVDLQTAREPAKMTYVSQITIFIQTPQDLPPRPPALFPCDFP